MLPSLLTLLLSAIPGVHAQDAVSLSYVKAGQVGTSLPGLTLTLHQDADDLSVDLTCGTKKFSRSGPAKSGAQIQMALDLPAGQWTCKGALNGRFSDGGEGSMPLSFGVTVYEPLKVTLASGSLDLAARRLSVTLDRRAGKVEVIATTLGGDVVGRAEVPSSAAAGTPIDVQWEELRPGEIIKIRVRGVDADGFWSDLELMPWQYRIPHEDVIFASASAEITPQEEPKLAEALARVQDTLKKYGADLVVLNLYVGGHTDTVGDAAYNRDLSLKRAMAIARWFKAHGFTGKIYYQGFGESDLAVTTADGVDEPRNRRVDYVVASQSPGNGWTVLP